MNSSQIKGRIGLPAIFLLSFLVVPILSPEETASPGAIYLALILLPLCAYTLMHANRRINNRYNIYAVLFGVSIIFSALFGKHGLANAEVIKGLLFILFFVFSTSFFISTKEILFLYWSCFILSLILGVLIVLSFLGGYPHNDSTFFMASYSIGVTGLYKNPNYLTSFINIFLFIFLYILFLNKYSLNKKILMSGVVGVFLVSFFLSGVRASLFTFALSMFFVLLEITRKKKTGLITVVFLGIIGLVLITYYSQILLDGLDTFSRSRAILEDEERSYSWSCALKHWWENPLWGCGLGSWKEISNHGGLMIWLHNVFLELLLEQGLIGVFLVLIILFTDFNRTKREDRFFLVSLMIVSGVPLFFQNGVNDFNFWRFVLINRVAFNYSIQSEMGIYNLITGKKVQAR